MAVDGDVVRMHRRGRRVRRCEHAIEDVPALWHPRIAQDGALLVVGPDHVPPRADDPEGAQLAKVGVAVAGRQQGGVVVGLPRVVVGVDVVGALLATMEADEPHRDLSLQSSSGCDSLVWGMGSAVRGGVQTVALDVTPDFMARAREQAFRRFQRHCPLELLAGGRS